MVGVFLTFEEIPMDPVTQAIVDLSHWYQNLPMDVQPTVAAHVLDVINDLTGLQPYVVPLPAKPAVPAIVAPPAHK